MESEGPVARATVGGNQLRAVVHDVVEAVAPEELPVVAGLAQLDDAVVLRRLRHRRRREPLGFGYAEAAALVTPVVWIVLTEAAKRMGTVAADGAATGLKGLLRKVRRRKTAPAVLPVPTAEQQAVIHRMVLESCRQRRISEKKATEIANAVIARLTLDR